MENEVNNNVNPVPATPAPELTTPPVEPVAAAAPVEASANPEPVAPVAPVEAPAASPEPVATPTEAVAEPVVAPVETSPELVASPEAVTAPAPAPVAEAAPVAEEPLSYTTDDASEYTVAKPKSNAKNLIIMLIAIVVLGAIAVWANWDLVSKILGLE